MKLRSVLAVLGALLGCQAGSDTALGVAQRFLDAHYVRIDLEAAKSYCTGLAASKIAAEQELVKGQVIDESTRQPRINYRLLETRDEQEDRVTFLFEGSIRVDDAGSFTRKWLVTTKKLAGGDWKVSNYREYD